MGTRQRAKGMKVLGILAAVALCVAGCGRGIAVSAGAAVEYENHFTGSKVAVGGPLAGEIIGALGREPDRAEKNVSATLDTKKYLHVGARTFQVHGDEIILLDDWGMRTWMLRNIETRLEALTGGAATGPAGGRELTWRKVEVSAGGGKAVLEVARFDPPVPFKAIPLAQTRRDTPLNTWISFNSHGRAGRNEDDLKRFAGHYLDPDYLLDLVRDKVKLPPEKYFERLRRAEKNSRAVGLVKYRQYSLLLYRFEGSGKFSDRTYLLAACMEEKDGAYYINERPKEQDPLLGELNETDFKQLGF